MVLTNYGNDNHQIYWGDCLAVMKELIKQGVKVDAIITDIPYNLTYNKYDSLIPFKEMWECLNLIKKDAFTPILLFADDPFAAHLQLSNEKMYRYKWYWNKERATDFLNSAWKPLKIVEQILVFIEKVYRQVPTTKTYKQFDLIPNYYPKFKTGKPLHLGKTKTLVKDFKSVYNPHSNKRKPTPDKIIAIDYDLTQKHPTNLLTFKKQTNEKHSFAKPVELIKYLVETYSKEEETILDFTAGGGSLLQSCLETNRKSISIEIDPDYINWIKERL